MLADMQAEDMSKINHRVEERHRDRERKIERQRDEAVAQRKVATTTRKFWWDLSPWDQFFQDSAAFLCWGPKTQVVF